MVRPPLSSLFLFSLYLIHNIRDTIAADDVSAETFRHPPHAPPPHPDRYPPPPSPGEHGGGYGPPNGHQGQGQGHPRESYPPYDYPPPPHHKPSPPRHSKHPTPHEQTYDVACCLPYWPADGYNQPQPLINQALFKDCPDKKTPEEICNAATDKLVSPPSILAVSVHKTLDVRHLQFPYYKAKSPFASDLAIVANGCCFNLYPDVRPYELLSSDCLNPLIGDNQDLVDSVFSTSIMVAGDADIIGTYGRSVVIGGDFLQDVPSPAQTEIATLGFGGPYKNGGFVLAGSVAATGGVISVVSGDFLLGGSDSGRVELNGGSKETLTDPQLTVEKISAQICAISTNIAALESNADVIYETVAPIRRRLDRTSSKDRVNNDNEAKDGRQLRSASADDTPDSDRQLTEEDPSPQSCVGECDVSGGPERRLFTATGGDYTLSFPCDEVDICVYEITAENLSGARGLIFPNSEAGQTLKINVYGTAVSTENFDSSSVVDVPSSTVIWNFPTASTVSILMTEADASWPGSVICPQCVLMEVIGPGLTGSIGLGNPSSVLTVNNAASDPSVTGSNGLPACPPPEPELIYCHCLCPEVYKKDHHTQHY